MEAVVHLHLSAAVSDYKHNVVLIHQLPLKPACQHTETGSVHWHQLPGCWQWLFWTLQDGPGEPSELVEFISDVKVNISKLEQGPQSQPPDCILDRSGLDGSLPSEVFSVS